MNHRKQAAQTALSMVDLTRLENDDTAQAITALCRRATTPYGSVAAVCISPRFVSVARATLDDDTSEGSVKLATVANFPGGDQTPADVVAQVAESLSHGADEIDLVFPWRQLLNDDAEAGRQLVAEVRRACGNCTLKVILETGELQRSERIREAAAIAIEQGADFLKTSTGKVPVNATPEAARLLLETIRESGRDVGCKVSGGIRTTDQAIEYLALAEEIMGPAWLTPAHFRIGASGLLDDLLGELDSAHRRTGDN